MFSSFKTLFVVGLAAFATAAPLRRHVEPVAAATSTEIVASSAVPQPSPSTPVEGPSSVTDILNDVVAQIKPLTATLSEYTPSSVAVCDAEIDLRFRV